MESRVLLLLELLLYLAKHLLLKLAGHQKLHKWSVLVLLVRYLLMFVQIKLYLFSVTFR